MNTKFGYGFDLNIFAVGAHGGETINAKDGALKAIPIFDRLQNDRGPICDGGGVLYRITTDEDILGGEAFLRQSAVRGPCPFAYPWQDEDEISDFRPMDFDAACYAAFAELLECIIETSPVGRVYVQIRCQGLEQSSLCGTWTPKRFGERVVRAGQLWGNMTYVLAKNADESNDAVVNRKLK